MVGSFKDGEFGWVPTVLLGGPFDGARYKMPILPDGSIPTGTSCPIGEYPDVVAYADYVRHDDEPIGGYYVYLYEASHSPEGTLLAHAPAPRTTSASAVEAVAN